MPSGAPAQVTQAGSLRRAEGALCSTAGAVTDMLEDSKSHLHHDIPVLLNSILSRWPLPDLSKPVTSAGVHMRHSSDSLICL